MKVVNVGLAKAHSKELYDLLRKPIDLERVRPFVEHCRECTAAFLKGLADAEGCVEKSKKKLGRRTIGNSDLRLLEYVAFLLKT